MALHLHLHGVSDVGRVRVRNEDSLATDARHGILVVADGMGGHPGGDVASHIAATETVRVLDMAVSRLKELSGGVEGVATLLGEAMVEAVTEAHRAIRRTASDPLLEGMGTTLTAMMLDPATASWAVGHVGDSRAYRIQGGSMTQLTRDDTWVQDRVDAGALTAQQARRHPYRHILSQCVGLEDPPDAQVVTGDAAPGDVHLLCTDGLVGMLEDGEILDIVEAALAPGITAGTVARATTDLVEAANERGGRDNVSVGILACTGTD